MSSYQMNRKPLLDQRNNELFTENKLSNAGWAAHEADSVTVHVYRLAFSSFTKERIPVMTYPSTVVPYPTEQIKKHLIIFI
jgi:hypothetical protein